MRNPRVRALHALGDGGRRAQLVAAIDRAGTVAGAARALGIPLRTAWRWMRELDIEAPHYRGDGKGD